MAIHDSFRYNQAKRLAHQLKFDTQNVYSKRPYFGKMRCIKLEPKAFPTYVPVYARFCDIRSLTLLRADLEVDSLSNFEEQRVS